jgi:hypothetical protein
LIHHQGKKKGKFKEQEEKGKISEKKGRKERRTKQGRVGGIRILQAYYLRAGGISISQLLAGGGSLTLVRNRQLYLQV